MNKKIILMIISVALIIISLIFLGVGYMLDGFDQVKDLLDKK